MDRSSFLVLWIVVLGSFSVANAGWNYNDDDYYADDYGNQNYYNKQNQQEEEVADDDDAAQDDGGGGNDDYSSAMTYQNYDDNWIQSDDDLFHWDNNVGFSGVSIMPVSCIEYNNGNMIKFEFFESGKSFGCHFAEIGSFVVSIAHYMRAYFNYQALVKGRGFSLPSDAGYLSCTMIEQTQYSSEPLYAKIGCKTSETYASTKLSLKVYTDAQCSEPYDDGRSTERHQNRGYVINGKRFSSKVSFRPPFYGCQSCAPKAISDTFNKRHGTWYDDDYISLNNNARGEDDYVEGYYQDDYADDYQDDYTDDGYLSANDDIYGNRKLVDEPLELTPVEGQMEAYEREFWKDFDSQQRELYANGYGIGDWNMCQRVYKYGVWCDEDCRAFDVFRTDRWSGADIILLSIMCTFVCAMMLLITAKRLKAAQKWRQYHDGYTMPGLPPMAMLTVFGAFIFIVFVMAKLKFVNETLVFAVLTSLLLFVYILKLVLFEKKRPKLLATRHDYFENPLDSRLTFD